MARILILTNPATLNILSTKDYLYSFGLYSKHEISYLPETPPAWRIGGAADILRQSEYEEIFVNFDVIVISQHLRLCFDGWINCNLHNALLSFSGVKIVFLHDEYDHTEKTRCWIEEQKVNTVYTVVPSEHISKVYDPQRFVNTEFKSILTGYMPLKFSVKQNLKPVAERENLIVYRGRVSPESYGELAKQKENIGRVIDGYCTENDIPVDIQWEEAKRIYGLKWYQLLESGVCTLGTESGSNVFDENGQIKKYIDAGGKLPGPASLNFKEENLGFKMNQIPPKLFEAIGCGTGLVLYEGGYSGVLEADEHFISLMLDHSNLSDVLEKAQDTELVQAMVDKTWSYISNNEKFSFEYFIKSFDENIISLVPEGKKIKRVTKPHLLVGDFDDVSSTGIGVYAELYVQASRINPKIINIARENPALHRSYKIIRNKVNSPLGYIYHIFMNVKHMTRIISMNVKHIARVISINIKHLARVISMNIKHIARKVYRFIPNRLPILGKIKRKFISTPPIK